MRIAAALAACACAGALAVGSAGAVDPVEPPPPSADIVVGTASFASHVKVFDGSTSALTASFFAFSGFTGGVDVGAGDVDGDGVADIVVGTASFASHVKVFDGATGALRASFFPFPGFTGGVKVAVGDVNGDGRADIVVGTASGASHVKVFDGSTSALIASFFAFAAGFTGGVDVGAGDVDGDGAADIVVGTASGASHVKVFDGATGGLRASFFSFAAGFTGGVHVAAGDVNGDGLADIVVGTARFASHVKVFDGSTFALTASFFAFAAGFTGGVDVGAGDVDGDGAADIVVGTASGASHVEVFDGVTGALRASFFSFAGFPGGVRVAGVPGRLAQPQPPPPDSDGDGIPDASDPDAIGQVVLELPAAAFAAKGHPKATLARLAGVEGLILAGDVDEAIAELEALRKRLDGCPATATSPEAADRNDWIVDCDAQRSVRAAIDGVLAALRSG